MQSQPSRGAADAAVCPDLTLCGQGSVHVPDAIQPHGVLLALSGAELTVACASRSCESLLSLAPEALLGHPLAQVTDASLAESVRAADVRLPAADVRLPGVLGLPASFAWRAPAGDCAFWCSVHRSGALLVLELEPEGPPPGDSGRSAAPGLGALHATALARMAGVRAQRSLSAKLEAAAALLRELTGYDRVMLCRVDADWHGEVVAESRRDDLEPRLGLGDRAIGIPLQARRGDGIGPMRVIADIEQPPSPVIRPGVPSPQSNGLAGGNQALDLSPSVLRGVSREDAESLRSLGVRATLIAPLLRDGRLCGLVVCQHGSPRLIPGRVRELVQWLAADLATQVALSEEIAERRHRERLRACRRRVLESVRAGTPLADLIAGPQAADLLGAVGAEGVALIDGDRVSTAGTTPERQQIDVIAARLAAGGAPAAPAVFASDCPSRDLPGIGEPPDTAVSLLALAAGDGPSTRLLYFRAGQPRQIGPAADPGTARTRTVGAGASPRPSLAVPRRTGCLPGPRWLAEEVESARELLAVIDIERRRSAEQALLHAQARLRSILDKSPVIVTIKDLEGRYRLVNRRCEALLGLSAADLAGKRADEVLAPPLAAACMAQDEAVRDSVEAQTFERIVATPHGSVTLLSVKFPLLDADGRIDGICAMSLDITERRQTERALAVTAAKYRAMFENFPLGITVCDTSGAIVETNAASELILGVTRRAQQRRTIDGPEWALERPDGSPYPAEDYPSVRALREGTVLRDQEMVLVSPAGERRWLNVTAAPLGVVGLGALVAYEDITERKEMQAMRESEAALRESERRFRKMADELPLMVWTLDEDLSCTFANQTCQTYLGVSAEALLARGFDALLHPDDRARFMGAFAAASRHRAPVQAETRIRRSDGAWRWIESFGRPMHESDGSYAGLLGISQDITERRSALRALCESNRALEQHAEQLERLSSALTRAEQRERERLAKLLHDHLQQLLVGAAFGIDRVRRRWEDLGGDSGGTAALAGVRQLLEQAIDTGRTLVADLSPPILREAGLPEALKWLARHMRDNHGLKIAVTVEPDLSPRADDLSTVIFESAREALFNVIKHAGCDRARIELARDADGWLCVMVSDEGAGFDLEVLSGADRDGTGFGILAMRERLRGLGGACVIDSRPGAGTRVTLRAPLDEMDESPARGGRLPASGPSAGDDSAPQPSSAAPISVLLVDDHAMVRQGLRALLDDEPMLRVVGEARDGLEALDLTERLRPELVLMDYSMPRMDGLEATRRINARWPDICVIGLSMYREADRSAAMLAAGARGYVDKSAGSDALLDAIRESMPERGGNP